MAITLQALQADGTWATRNAFVTENKQVTIGAMKAADLEAKARALMAQWQATMPDGKALRVHNSDNDRKPAARATSFESKARQQGWRTTQEAHGDGTESYGVVHADGRWAPDFESALAFHNSHDYGPVEGARAGIIEALGGAFAHPSLEV